MTNTIILPRSVVEQALEALETGIQYDYHGNSYSDNDAARCGAYDALRAALERPKPLPSTVWRFVPTTMTDAMAAVDKELRHAVPWVRWDAILAAAPQPPRQPLTDAQINDCFQHRHRDKATERRMITRAIELTHGITGEQA